MRVATAASDREVPVPQRRSRPRSFRPGPLALSLIPEDSHATVPVEGGGSNEPLECPGCQASCLEIVCVTVIIGLAAVVDVDWAMRV